jgi:hypothetical protein
MMLDDVDDDNGPCAGASTGVAKVRQENEHLWLAEYGHAVEMCVTRNYRLDDEILSAVVNVEISSGWKSVDDEGHYVLTKSPCHMFLLKTSDIPFTVPGDNVTMRAYANPSRSAGLVITGTGSLLCLGIVLAQTRLLDSYVNEDSLDPNSRLVACCVQTVDDVDIVKATFFSTALHLAMRCDGGCSIALSLVELGADMDAKDSLDATPRSLLKAKLAEGYHRTIPQYRRLKALFRM